MLRIEATSGTVMRRNKLDAARMADAKMAESGAGAAATAGRRGVLMRAKTGLGLLGLLGLLLRLDVTTLFGRSGHREVRTVGNVPGVVASGRGQALAAATGVTRTDKFGMRADKLDIGLVAAAVVAAALQTTAAARAAYRSSAEPGLVRTDEMNGACPCVCPPFTHGPSPPAIFHR